MVQQPVTIDSIYESYHRHSKVKGNSITDVASAVLSDARKNAHKLKEKQWPAQKILDFFEAIGFYGSNIEKVHRSIQRLTPRRSASPLITSSNGNIVKSVDNRVYNMKETIEFFYLFKNILPCNQEIDDVDVFRMKKAAQKQRRAQVHTAFVLAEKMNGT